MKPEVIKQNLQRSILFQDFSHQELDHISAVCSIKVIPEGELVFQQGDASDDFSIVAMGEVELSRYTEAKGRSIVSRVGPGGHFGETSILTHRPHSLTARALCDTVLISFSERIFLETLLSDRRIHLQLDKALSERLRVAFHESVGATSPHIKNPEKIKGLFENVILFEEEQNGPFLPGIKRINGNRSHQSQSGRKVRDKMGQFAGNLEPIFLNGEPGTGRRLISKQIHLNSSYSSGPYIEVDLREYSPETIKEYLLGNEHEGGPFTQIDSVGTFEKSCGGTVCLMHLDSMDMNFQLQLCNILESGVYYRIGGLNPVALQSRLIFICDREIKPLVQEGKLLPDLARTISKQQFGIPPLRDHKRDLPLIVDHYLKQYCKEYGKPMMAVSPDTLGILMNYDWPGNLTELSSVIERAVMLSRQNEILSDQILLGLPKTEGKWEFNTLRLSWVKNYLRSKIFPALPRTIVGIVILIAVAVLFLGAKEPTKNLGMSISWSIGWPILFFSFFFLARIWCSVCTLAMPGTLLQKLLKPSRSAPRFIKNYSGWIMATLCILVMWVEIVWNAYHNTYLTGSIILAVTVGSMVTSALFKRRVWCRYLCPLGAINAIFAMPAVLELRSTRPLCLNNCQEHVCYVGDDEDDGCPMFRHPFMVDNNKDCIVCAKCIKSCNLNSIQLNLRLAPQELWSIQVPRLADSFLIVSLGAIFFPFAMQENFGAITHWLVEVFAQQQLLLPYHLVATLMFFGLILFFQVGYYYLVSMQARYSSIAKNMLLPLLGYGFIPLILGGYMAVHFEMFMGEAWRIAPNFQELMGWQVNTQPTRLMSEDGTSVLQRITVIGGLLASLYAVYRIITRLRGERPLTSETLFLPYFFQIILAILFMFML